MLTDPGIRLRCLRTDYIRWLRTAETSNASLVCLDILDRPSLLRLRVIDVQ